MLIPHLLPLRAWWLTMDTKVNGSGHLTVEIKKCTSTLSSMLQKLLLNSVYSMKLIRILLEQTVQLWLVHKMETSLVLGQQKKLLNKLRLLFPAVKELEIVMNLTRSGMLTLKVKYSFKRNGSLLTPWAKQNNSFGENGSGLPTPVPHKNWMSGLVTMVLKVNSVSSLPTKMLEMVQFYTKHQHLVQWTKHSYKMLLLIAGRIVKKTLKTVPGKLMTLLTNLSWHFLMITMLTRLLVV